MLTVTRILLFLFLLFSNKCFGQSQNIACYEPSKSFPIKDEGMSYPISLTGDTDIITSDLIINEDTINSIRSSYAKLSGDSLLITLYGNATAYYHKYRVTIYKNHFDILYDYKISGPYTERKIVTITSKLILNTDDFLKGNIVRGFTQFYGECVRGGCEGKKFNIKGNFKALIE
jgi:hypothetical protein